MLLFSANRTCLDKRSLEIKLKSLTSLKIAKTAVERAIAWINQQTEALGVAINDYAS